MVQVVFDKSNYPYFYLKKSSQVRVPFNGSELVIDDFFVAGSIDSYLIIAGIGRNREETYLIGRALSDGNYQEGKTQSYRCREISDFYAGPVRAVLESYKKVHGLTDDVKLWGELSNHNNPEQTQELPAFKQLELELSVKK